MDGELAERLRAKRHHARVMRSRRHLVEKQLVTFHKKFHAEDAVTTHGVGHHARYIVRLSQHGR